jgi:hypothetical protein
MELTQKQTRLKLALVGFVIYAFGKCYFRRIFNGQCSGSWRMQNEKFAEG